MLWYTGKHIPWRARRILCYEPNILWNHNFFQCDGEKLAVLAVAAEIMIGLCHSLELKHGLGPWDTRSSRNGGLGYRMNKLLGNLWCSSCVFSSIVSLLPAAEILWTDRYKHLSVLDHPSSDKMILDLINGLPFLATGTCKRMTRTSHSWPSRFVFSRNWQHLP